jgi:AhpD family alkylhydroperoxidase
MSRISISTPESVPAASKLLLDGVHKKLGVVPNMFRVIALSPAALEGFLGLKGALSRTLDVRTRERIAIAVAERNGCDYCLSAHTYLSLNLAKSQRKMRRWRGKVLRPTPRPPRRSVLRFRS